MKKGTYDWLIHKIVTSIGNNKSVVMLEIHIFHIDSMMRSTLKDHRSHLDGFTNIPLFLKFTLCSPFIKLNFI